MAARSNCCRSISIVFADESFVMDLRPRAGGSERRKWIGRGDDARPARLVEYRPGLVLAGRPKLRGNLRMRMRPTDGSVRPSVAGIEVDYGMSRRACSEYECRAEVKRLSPSSCVAPRAGVKATVSRLRMNGKLILPVQLTATDRRIISSSVVFLMTCCVWRLAI